MAIRIVRHTEEFRSAATEFNKRMHDAGSRWGIYLNPDTDWLSGQTARKVRREHYIAVDDDGTVHGGFVLKPQEWLIRGELHIVTDWQGPVSEGSINPRYATLAIRLMREMTKLYPAVFSWGHGGSDQPVVQMLKKMGWPMYEAPFCLLVINPFRFLRLNSYLRQTVLQKAVLNLAAYSGAGWLFFSTYKLMKRLVIRNRFNARAAIFEDFEQWSDDLWQRCKSNYEAIAVRDAEAMNLLAPSERWPPVVRLRIERSGEPIGWSLVMHTEMQSDSRFGDLHVGSIVDCLAEPDDAAEVVWASTQYLKEVGVDIVVSNQSHPAWVRGFSDNGYLILPNRRLFVTSPALREMLEPFEEVAKGLHLTNMDGHGPHSL